jgi:hypothetical protein
MYIFSTIHGSLGSHGINKNLELVDAVLEVMRNSLFLALYVCSLSAHDFVDCDSIVTPVHAHDKKKLRIRWPSSHDIQNKR